MDQNETRDSIQSELAWLVIKLRRGGQGEHVPGVGGGGLISITAQREASPKRGKRGTFFRLQVCKGGGGDFTMWDIWKGIGESVTLLFQFRTDWDLFSLWPI